MSTSRSYGDACGIARALDVVGERWALLIVRELLLGPQRFSDLRRALPAASSNILADRLRELEGHAVLARRTLPPPAASTVYELTERGRQLEEIVLALGAWGLEVPLPPAPRVSPVSSLLFLRGSLRPEPSAPAAVYRLEVDGGVWTLETVAGQAHIRPGEPTAPIAELRADAATLNAVLTGQASFDASLADGTVTVGGDLGAARRLLSAVT